MPLLRFIKACNWRNSDRMGTSSLIIHCSLCLESNYSIQNGVIFWKKLYGVTSFLLAPGVNNFCTNSNIHFISLHWVTQDRCCFWKERITLVLQFWMENIIFAIVEANFWEHLAKLSFIRYKISFIFFWNFYCFQIFGNIFIVKSLFCLVLQDGRL